MGSCILSPFLLEILGARVQGPPLQGQWAVVELQQYPGLSKGVWVLLWVLVSGVLVLRLGVFFNF